MKISAKRLLSMLIVLAMALSMLPMFTFAAETDAAKILTEAYALAEGASLSYEATLTGEITSVKNPYDPTYNNISVIIEVAGHADKPMLCYRMKGDGVDQLAVGDTVTVTGTITNYYGTIEYTAGCTLDSYVKGENEVVVAPEDPKEIVDAAYALEGGASLPYTASLTGTVTEIVSEYSEQYKNITVNMVVAGREDKPIQCYRMKGTGADTLAVGDKITVSGTLKNYVKTDSETGVTTSTIEFTPCSLLNVVKPATEEDLEAMKAIVDAAYELEKDASMEEAVTLVGKIISIDTPYSSQYSNITVTIAVSGREDKPIQCYRMKGTGADTLAVGDTITVTGTLTNYKGTTVQFKSGCTLDDVIKGDGEVVVAPEDPKEIVDAAYALAPGAVLPYEATLTGKVTEIVDAYSEQYQNITVNMVIEGREDKPIQCYRMKGEGAETLEVGDTITVTGNLKNYSKTDSETGVTTNTIEFTPCTLVAVVKGEEPSVGATVSGAVTSYGDAAAAVTVELWAEGAEEAAYAVTAVEGTYSIVAVAAGTYTLKVSKLNHVTREYTVTVEAEAVTQDVKIHMIGDVDGNGKVNMGDVAKINSHIKGTIPLTDEYQILCANINGGSLNMGDTAALYAHIKGTKLLY